jgi:hypothetical protein
MLIHISRKNTKNGNSDIQTPIVSQRWHLYSQDFPIFAFRIIHKSPERATPCQAGVKPCLGRNELDTFLRKKAKRWTVKKEQEDFIR